MNDQLSESGDLPEGLDISRYAQAFVTAFPVSGAAVSTLGDLLGSETLAASDGQAARLDELQFDLGEGPCWDAMALGRPVLEPAVRTTERWPAFTEAIRDQQISSLFAFPLRVGTLRIGAVDLYSREPVQLAAEHRRKASSMAEQVSREVLRGALTDMGVEPDGGAGKFSRRLIHQATGVVLAQLRLSPADALLVIEGHAFASSRSVAEIAEAIVEGRLDLAQDPATPEGPAGAGS